MSTEFEALTAMTTDTTDAEAPSAEWIKAVSEYLDTDPSDLLAELGYYDRPEETREASDTAAPAAHTN